MAEVYVEQPPLFDPPEAPPFQRHSDTSRAAAHAIRPNAATLRGQVLALIEAHPAGVTDEEGIEALGMNPSTYRPRRIELVERDLIHARGKRRTHSGRSATVWVATQYEGRP